MSICGVAPRDGIPPAVRRGCGVPFSVPYFLCNFFQTSCGVRSMPLLCAGVLEPSAAVQKSDFFFRDLGGAAGTLFLEGGPLPLSFVYRITWYTPREQHLWHAVRIVVYSRRPRTLDPSGPRQLGSNSIRWVFDVRDLVPTAVHRGFFLCWVTVCSLSEMFVFVINRTQKKLR